MGVVDWMYKHPWMTFFIVLSLIETIGYMVKYITGYKDIKKEEDEEE